MPYLSVVNEYNKYKIECQPQSKQKCLLHLSLRQYFLYTRLGETEIRSICLQILKKVSTIFLEIQMSYQTSH